MYPAKRQNQKARQPWGRAVHAPPAPPSPVRSQHLHQNPPMPTNSRVRRPTAANIGHVKLSTSAIAVQANTHTMRPARRVAMMTHVTSTSGNERFFGIDCACAQMCVHSLWLWSWAVARPPAEDSYTFLAFLYFLSLYPGCSSDKQLGVSTHWVGSFRMSARRSFGGDEIFWTGRARYFCCANDAYWPLRLWKWDQ